jgi:hypothetical protein
VAFAAAAAAADVASAAAAAAAAADVAYQLRPAEPCTVVALDYSIQGEPGWLDTIED